MNRKEVKFAATTMPVRDQFDHTKRLVGLVVAKEGTFRTDEKWAHDAASSLADQNVVSVRGDIISIGPNFEPFLLSAISADAAFGDTLYQYRSLIHQRIKEFDLSDDAVSEHLESLGSVDDKIMYLTTLVSSTSAKLKSVLEKSQLLESTMAEIDSALSVVESVLDENTHS
jgi:hypothetical protein